MADTRHLGRAVFLYDGDCAFCTSCARFVERHIPARADLQPWQVADLDALGVTQADAEHAVQWIGPDGTVAAGPEAIARLLVDAGPSGRAGPSGESGRSGQPGHAGRSGESGRGGSAGAAWRLVGRGLDLPPLRWLAWPAYRLVARNRHRLPGGTPACSLSQAERDH